MKLTLVSMVATAALLTLGAQAEPGATEPHDAEQLVTLAVETDKCDSVLRVDDGAKYKTIPRGVWTRATPAFHHTDDFAFHRGRFAWKCGDTTEHTRCPAGTKAVNVFHAKSSRDITWNCLDN